MNTYNISKDISCYLNELNEEEGLSFDEATHSYSLAGVPCKSVSSIIDSVSEKFDSMAVALKKEKGDLESAKKLIEKWEEKGRLSREHGHEVHRCVHENVLKYFKTGHLFASENKEANVCLEFLGKLLNDGANIISSEQPLFCKDNLICGTADLIYIIEKNKSLSIGIIDWKTGEPSKWGPTRFTKPLLNQMQQYNDSAKTKYSAQLSFYAFMIKKMLHNSFYDSVPIELNYVFFTKNVQKNPFVADNLPIQKIFKLK